VTREELRQRLWPADTFVDFDHGLYNAIKRLREALGDVADTPRFIETVPKRGYRFIGEVTGNSQPAAQGAAGADRIGETPLSPPLPPAQSRSRKKRLLVLAGVGGLALILFLLVPFNVGDAGDGGARLTKIPQIHGLAVLPLKNLSDDPGQEYFSYGMTDQLITDLAHISGLKVISHTSVLQYEKGTKSLPQIAGELGVDGIVEGSVQRSGNRVRITAQLIYAPQEQHLWADTYDRHLQDVLTLQSSVAAAIAESIRSKTGASLEAARKPAASPSIQAMDDYLQGKYSIQRMASGDGLQGFEAAIQYFRKAISEAPDYAPAYVALANAYDVNYDYRPNEIKPLQKAALMKALELDPGSADSHVVKARIYIDDCDLDGAESEFKEALRLNPNLADAHYRYSSYLADVGRVEESILEAKRAQELDPEGPSRFVLLVANHEYDQIITLRLQYLELHPYRRRGPDQCLPFHRKVSRINRGLAASMDPVRIQGDRAGGR
jgi:TolB-like protein